MASLKRKVIDLTLDDYAPPSPKRARFAGPEKHSPVAQFDQKDDDEAVNFAIEESLKTAPPSYSPLLLSEEWKNDSVSCGGPLVSTSAAPLNQHEESDGEDGDGPAVQIVHDYNEDDFIVPPLHSDVDNNKDNNNSNSSSTPLNAEEPQPPAAPADNSNNNNNNSSSSSNSNSSSNSSDSKAEKKSEVEGKDEKKKRKPRKDPLGIVKTADLEKMTDSEISERLAANLAMITERRREIEKLQATMCDSEDADDIDRMCEQIGHLKVQVEKLETERLRLGLFEQGVPVSKLALAVTKKLDEEPDRVTAAQKLADSEGKKLVPTIVSFITRLSQRHQCDQKAFDEATKAIDWGKTEAAVKLMQDRLKAQQTDTLQKVLEIQDKPENPVPESDDASEDMEE